MATRLVEPYQTYLDNNNDPLNGGLLYFYETGTTTPKDTYSNKTLSSANANPVVLNSAGRVTGDVWGEGEYKLVVKNSSGATQATYDPLRGVYVEGRLGVASKAAMSALLSGDLTAAQYIDVDYRSLPGDGGGGVFRVTKSDISTEVTNDPGGIFYIPFDADGTGASGGFIRESYLPPGNVIVEWAGCTTGSSDNKTAIDNIRTYLYSATLADTGGVIKFGKGTYISSALSFGSGSAYGQIRIEGVGISTVLKAKDGINDDFLTIDAHYCTVRDMQIDGNMANQTAGVTLALGSNCFFVNLFSVRIRNGYTYGLSSNGGNQINCYDVRVFSSGKGVYQQNTTQMNWYGGTIEDNSAGGYVLQGSSSRNLCSLNGVYFEDNDDDAGGAAHIDYAGYLGDNDKLSVMDCYLGAVGDTATQVGIKIDGTGVDGVRVRSHFNGLAANWDLSGIGSGDAGTNDVRGCTYESGSAPTPTYGFIQDDSQKFSILSDEIDLTGGAVTTPFYAASGTRPIRITKVVEHTTSATDSDTSTTLLKVGYIGSVGAFLSDNPTASASANDLNDRTGDLATTEAASASKILTYGKDSGTESQGAVRLHIEGWVY